MKLTEARPYNTTVTEVEELELAVLETNIFGQVIEGHYILAPYTGEGHEMNQGHSTGYDWEDDDYDMPIGFRA